MGAVVMAVAGDNIKFVALACINVVVAANAGGAFSPFGDITTLMVWQKGVVEFHEFFSIFVPSAVNWLVPAAVMSLFVGKEPPKEVKEQVRIKFGGFVIIGLFLLTIATAVSFHNFLHLPPAAGMMLGMAYLGAYSYYIKRYEGRSEAYDTILGTRTGDMTYEPLTRLIRRKVSIDRFMDRMPEPTFAIDNNHVITHWNRAMEDLTGIPAGEAIGTTNQWKPFYQSRRPSMADMVLDYHPEKVMGEHYQQGVSEESPCGRCLRFERLFFRCRRRRQVGYILRPAAQGY